MRRSSRRATIVRSSIAAPFVGVKNHMRRLANHGHGAVRIHNPERYLNAYQRQWLAHHRALAKEIPHE
jgi:hypothetical protein